MAEEMHSDTPGPAEELEVMSQRECLALLRGTHLGRLGLVDWDVRPLIFPVNYVFDDGAVVFRTGKGSKLDLAPGAHVCFEIDGWSAGAGIGWSVLVKGIAHDVTEPRGMPVGRMRALPVRPVAPGRRDHWIGIEAEEITGRRFSTEAHRPPSVSAGPRSRANKAMFVDLPMELSAVAIRRRRHS